MSGDSPAGAPTGTETKGLYRDGEFLVAAMQGAVFPNRCVATNEPTTGPKFRFREKVARFPLGGSGEGVRVVARGAAAAAKGAALGAAAMGAQAAVGVAAAPLVALLPVVIYAGLKTLILEIGWNEERQRRFHRWRAICLWLVLGGGGVFVVLPFALVFLQDVLPQDLPPAAGVAVVVVLAPIAASPLLGLILFAVFARQPLKLVRAQQGYVWLKGAHPDFLASLTSLDDLAKQARPSAPSARR